MSDKFGNGRNLYSYPSLNIIRSRLGIHRAQRLTQAAYKLTALHAATIKLGPLKRGLPHLYAIHHQLYRDIFDWVGRLREVDIYQGDTRFCYFAYIEKEDNALMQDLEDKSWPAGLPGDRFVDRFARYYYEISALHPSRVDGGLA